MYFLPGLIIFSFLYSQQLAAQIENLTQQLNIKASENHGFAKRETDLVQHVQRLENQLQSFIQNPRNKTEINSSLPAVVAPLSQPIINQNELQVLRLKVAELDKCIVELQLEREKLQDSLSQEVRVRNFCEELEFGVISGLGIRK